MSALRPLFRTLGLPEGADQAAIDLAYRRLIKRHHPDRPGGDGDRAAEINRAYTILKDPGRRARFERDSLIGAPQRHRPTPPPMVQPRRPLAMAAPPARRSRGVGLLLATGLLAAFAAAADDPRLRWQMVDSWDDLARQFAPLDRSNVTGGFAVAAGKPQPINRRAVAEGSELALSLVRSKGLAAAAEASRDCYRDYRQTLSSARLDGCLAFDHGVAASGAVEGQEDEERYFSAISITARQIAAAQLQSSDYDWIENRLDSIRTEAERRASPPPPLPQLPPLPGREDSPAAQAAPAGA